uniref:8-amino-7-oxononanoate synthase n=1 Tax=Paulinella longichromatophora TaxID=1708747 RepID=A0A2H4ZNN7_9EUKA|nr:putative 8-amino-7-oxononanoate synthase [Paulinella longichromatophora]
MNNSMSNDNTKIRSLQHQLYHKLTTIPNERRRTLHGLNPRTSTTFQRSSSFEQLLDLASNDYLSLSRHPNVQNAALIAMRYNGVGAGASRLVSGTRSLHFELECTLAHWLGRKKVLLFPSGFQANLAAVQALADRHTIVLADKLIHYSLLAGIRCSGAILKRFDHNNLVDLEYKLKTIRSESTGRPLLVISESLFSMEGTSPNIPDLICICKTYKSRLLIDEAHAIGILGLGGRGLSYGLSGVDIISGTFGKAFGSSGGFLATNDLIGNWLLQTSGAFRYSTALAPPLVAAALAALELIQSNPFWGEDLCKRSISWRNKLEQAGWPRPQGIGPIIPLLIGDDHQTLFLKEKLEGIGLSCPAIRPPTVPNAKSRLRFVLSRNIPTNILSRLIKNLVR